MRRRSRDGWAEPDPAGEERSLARAADAVERRLAEGIRPPRHHPRRVRQARGSIAAASGCGATPPTGLPRSMPSSKRRPATRWRGTGSPESVACCSARVRRRERLAQHTVRQVQDRALRIVRRRRRRHRTACRQPRCRRRRWSGAMRSPNCRQLPHDGALAGRPRADHRRDGGSFKLRRGDVISMSTQGGGAYGPRRGARSGGDCARSPRGEDHAGRCTRCGYGYQGAKG